MANFATFLLSITSQAFAMFPLLAVLLMNTELTADAKEQPVCSPFSCGHLQDIHSPFRLHRDPPECGFPGYELVCSDNKAVLYINQGRYYVIDISYNHSNFWVVDASLGNSTCTLPMGNLSLSPELGIYSYPWATFMNCSSPIKNGVYRPVSCLSGNNWFVYVMAARDARESFMIQNLEPSCGFLATIPMGDRSLTVPENASYGDVLQIMKNGFAIPFPETYGSRWLIHKCLNESIGYLNDQISNMSIIDRISALVLSEMDFSDCIIVYSDRTPLFLTAVAIVSSIAIVQFIIVPAILCRFVFAPLAVFTFLAYKFVRTKMSIDAVEKFLRKQQALGPTRYAYTDLIAITGHFREKLGEGGYGSVYKGVRPGDVYVAVKMLGNSKCNGEEFISEVSTIGRIHHVNVVRLVGFCSEESRRALVYEYMPHGSLEKYIFSSERSFSWDKLNEIALGIALGIDYLHRGCDMQILHFDIKPHNILLDQNFTPKIADFGLAKLYPKDYSLVSMSAARGTIGYIAPELVSRSFGVISSKSDVYSFGMLLLEMAGGRRNADPHAENSSQGYYPSWVYNRLTRQEVGEISEAVDVNEVERKLCIVGLWCIQMKSHERPMMSEVVEMLEAGVDGLEMPPKPFFCGDEHISVMDSCHFSSELSVISENE